MDLALLLDTSIILSTKEHIVEPKPTAVDLKLQLQSFYFNQKIEDYELVLIRIRYTCDLLLRKKMLIVVVEARIVRMQ